MESSDHATACAQRGERERREERGERERVEFHFSESEERALSGWVSLEPRKLQGVNFYIRMLHTCAARAH